MLYLQPVIIILQTILNATYLKSQSSLKYLKISFSCKMRTEYTREPGQVPRLPCPRDGTALNIK